MWRTAGIVAGLALLPAIALAQTDERYGRTDIFEVGYFYENDVCAAYRDIVIEDELGSGGVYNGSFMFGAVQVDGEVFGLISVQDPDIAMELGQDAYGTVAIDGRTYDAYLAADDVDLLTAYIEFSLLPEIAYGDDAVLGSPNLTYTLPLDGTLRAFRILEICFEDKFPVRGIDRGDVSFTKKKKSKPNPLE